MARLSFLSITIFFVSCTREITINTASNNEIYFSIPGSVNLVKNEGEFYDAMRCYSMCFHDRKNDFVINYSTYNDEGKSIRRDTIDRLAVLAQLDAMLAKNSKILSNKKTLVQGNPIFTIEYSYDIAGKNMYILDSQIFLPTNKVLNVRMSGGFLPLDAYRSISNQILNSLSFAMPDNWK